MAEVKLGQQGSEVTLPVLKGLGDIPPWPVEMERQAEEKKMSDGSLKYAYYGIKRVFDLTFGYLTLSQLNTIRDLYYLNDVLRYQNKNEDSTWYDVVMLSFSYQHVRESIRKAGFKYFTCSVTLKQV